MKAFHDLAGVEGRLKQLGLVATVQRLDDVSLFLVARTMPGEASTGSR